MNKVRRRYFTALALLMILTGAAFSVNVFIGSINFSPVDIVKAFFGTDIENLSDIL